MEKLAEGVDQDKLPEGISLPVFCLQHQKKYDYKPKKSSKPKSLQNTSTEEENNTPDDKEEDYHPPKNHLHNPPEKSQKSKNPKKSHSPQKPKPNSNLPSKPLSSTTSTSKPPHPTSSPLDYSLSLPLTYKETLLSSLTPKTPKTGQPLPTQGWKNWTLLRLNYQKLKATVTSVLEKGGLSEQARRQFEREM